MTERLTTHQICALRGQAQRLDAVLKLGKNGITDGFLQSVSTALDQHELIKVKLTDHKDQRRTLASELAEKSGSALVTLIGNVIVLYRENADPAKRKIKV
ncbi:MAG: YhbY family RNA-binding protein [Verrucomicrobia bacterium]|nr:YhbY family RNA-binding protein [Verrucomicrobiota bacterium]